jgi:hypothetical protein
VTAEPLNPETLARGRFEQVESLLEQRERVAREHTETQREAERLRDRLDAARQENRQAEAVALAEGRPVPADDELERLEAEVTAIGRRLEGFAAAAQLVETDLALLRIGNREEWEAAQTRAVEAATARVEEATAALADERALLGWVTENVTLPLTAEQLAEADAWSRMGQARIEADYARAVVAHHTRSTPASDSMLANRVRLAELERRARK